MKISELTRRDIFDGIQLENIVWSGRLDDVQFLSRMYDLESLPSTDSRFSNAQGDIWQHRFNNDDWEDDWVFQDTRFSLQRGEDDILLRFLCETIHPVVRQDPTEVERLKQLYNDCLKQDGFKIIEKTRISGKPVYTGRDIGAINPNVANIQTSFTQMDAGYVSQQITRMEASVHNDPSLAIGTAKELVETCCKTILKSRNVEVSKNLDLPKLIKKATKELALTPDDIEDKAKASDTIKKLLSNLATITNGIAELRNSYGTGHGKVAATKGLSPRHAKLAVGAASTLAIFLLETHQERSE